MNSNLIQSEKKENSQQSEIKKFLRKYILTAENIFCLSGFLLSVFGYFFTDFDPFQGMNLVLAFVFVIYIITRYCFRVITSEEKGKLLKTLILPGVILLILGDLLWMATGLHTVSEILLLPYSLEMAFIRVLTDTILPFFNIPSHSVSDIAYTIKAVLLNLSTLGLLITLDILLLISVIKNRRLTGEKTEYTVKWGILAGIRYLAGVYQLVFLILIPSLMVEVFLDPNTGLFPDDYNHGIQFFVISPLVLFSFVYIVFCKYFFKESKKRDVGIAVSLLPFLFVMATVIITDSVDNFTDLYQNGSTGVMLYLYAARDLILLLFTAVGMIVAVFAKRIPAIRLMLAFYALTYLLTMFSLPEYWIVKDIIDRRQTEDYIASDNLDYPTYGYGTTMIVEASSDATPAIKTLLDEMDETEWQECLEYLEMKKQGSGPVCTTCEFHYKYEWLNCHYQEEAYGNLSRARSIKIIQEKLNEINEN